jgi:formylglycine-generating enzyme required for sulfatase activity
LATFGKYEVVTELHSGESGAVFSARAVGGGREIKYAVKTFNPHTLDLDEQFYESQSFVERARVQQQVSEAGSPHWAPIHDTGTSPAGTYYVTDFHPLSAASLVTGRVEVSPGVLYAIVKSVLGGLTELKTAAGRAHGNLKATNVLISSRGDVAVAGAVLTDPASANDAARVGEAGDLRSLGELIHLLVLGRPFNGRTAWPLAQAREWARLGGRQGRLWRKLCNDLLAPDPTQRPESIEIVARRVRRLIPRRARPSRRLSLAVAVVVVLLAAGAAAVLGVRDAGARKEVCAAKNAWAGGLSAALSDPKRRALLNSDPDLTRVVQELDVADLGSFDCDRTGGRFTFNPNLRQFRRTQETLQAVRRAERGLSPIQWQQLARAAALQGRFEARGWMGPARHLAECIAGARPGSSNLADGIERFLLALAAVDLNLPAVEEKWVLLQTRTRSLEGTRDPVMKAFASHLRTAAASSVSLTDAGFGSLDGVSDASERSERLLKVHGELDHGDYDESRFGTEVVQTIDLKNVRAADIDRWLTSVEGYRVRKAEILQAVLALKEQQEENERLVRESGIEEKQANEFQERASIVKFHVSQFGGRKFIQRDIDDGEFRKSMEVVRAHVASLKGFIRMEDVELWLKKLDALGVASRELNAYWELRKESVEQTAKRLAGQPQQLAELQAETRRLREVLLELDGAVPPVPKDMSPEPPVSEVLVKAAEVKREEALGSLLKDRTALTLARQADGANKARESEAVKAAAASFEQWTADLVALGKDFPLRQAILTPDVRPDEKWVADKPDFWNDRIVQSLVERDVERLRRLRALQEKPRDALAKAAESENREELALHAWRLLGAERIEPAWPTRQGELATEAKIRRRLVELLVRFAQTPEGRDAAKELREEAPRRWQRFAKAAGADEAMLASAVALRDAFGVEAAHFSALPAEARFNLSLLEARRHLRDQTDEGLAAVVADLTRAARELQDKGVAAELALRLARLDDKEPFADEARGDEFRLRPAGTDVEIVFRRVKPEGKRPFFLGTGEVSFAQFAAVVDAASGWDDLRSIVWSPQPGEIGDPRRGPRTWEWVMRPAPRMYAPQWWLFPEDANDYPKEFRDPRVSKFNRTVLSDAVGGNPSERHPVQYVPAEAAMYFAALCGCRLPTPAEWRAAYDGFEKDVPPAEWNLRDKTWVVQRDHAAGARSADAGHSPPLPDDGIYLPPVPKAQTGAAARAFAHADGTLFFRPAGESGGGTFRHLVGNVAEFVCDASEPFEQLADKRPLRLKAFAAESARALFVIGGSALSPPEVPLNTPMPVKPGAAFADVGFRLAFTAPSRSLGEKLEWVLAGQGFVQPGGASKTASAASEKRG